MLGLKKYRTWMWKRCGRKFWRNKRINTKSVIVISKVLALLINYYFQQIALSSKMTIFKGMSKQPQMRNLKGWVSSFYKLLVRFTSNLEKMFPRWPSVAAFTFLHKICISSENRFWLSTDKTIITFFFSFSIFFVLLPILALK